MLKVQISFPWSIVLRYNFRCELILLLYMIMKHAVEKISFQSVLENKHWQITFNYHARPLRIILVHFEMGWDVNYIKEEMTEDWRYLDL